MGAQYITTPGQLQEGLIISREATYSDNDYIPVTIVTTPLTLIAAAYYAYGSCIDTLVL